MAEATAAAASSSAQEPQGWAYNPSGWMQRIPIVVLGYVGMCIAGYLAAYQVGYVAEPWDPVFGSDSTRRVLDSPVSKLFPVHDALLGAVGYAGDWVFGLVGGRHRYRTMPWAVLVFGFFIIPFGGTSIFLGLAMPTLVGSWCFLCLVNTVLAIIMIPMTWDEVWLTILAIREMRRRGASFWDALSGRAGREPLGVLR